MTQFPAAVDGVRCLVGPQPVTMKTIVQRRPEPMLEWFAKHMS